MQLDRVSFVAELAMLHAYSGNANFRGRDISLSGPTATCTAATLQSKKHLDTANGIGFREWSMAEWAEVQCWNLECSDAELSSASMTIHDNSIKRAAASVQGKVVGHSGVMLQLQTTRWSKQKS